VVTGQSSCTERDVLKLKSRTAYRRALKQVTVVAQTYEIGNVEALNVPAPGAHEAIIVSADHFFSSGLVDFAKWTWNYAEHALQYRLRKPGRA
jgi:hypothetical protein